MANSLQDRIRTYGLFGLIYRLFYKLYQKLIFERTRILVFCIQSSDAKADAEPRDDELAFTAADATLFSEYAQRYPYLSHQIPLLDERLSNGDIPYLVFDQNELVHVAWWGVRTEVMATYELGYDCRIPLAQPSVLIFDCWTPDHARGKGYYPAVLRRLVEGSLPDYPAVWIYCLDINIASKRGIEKAGFQYVHFMQRTTWFHFFHFDSVE